MTEKEIQRLEKSTSAKMQIFVHSIMFFLVLATLWGGGYKIYQAHQLASIEGISLKELFNDVDIHRQFSGVYVTASKWLIEGIYRVIPTILYITLWALLSVLAQRNKLILELKRN